MRMDNLKLGDVISPGDVLTFGDSPEEWEVLEVVEDASGIVGYQIRPKQKSAKQIPCHVPEGLRLST